MTALSFLYYEMVKKRDIWRGGQNLRIWRYVTLERPHTYKNNPEIAVTMVTPENISSNYNPDLEMRRYHRTSSDIPDR